MNKKGFTLIELLAVLVIMGILMLVAIPTMSNVINNSRKDTFIETIETYNNSVKTMWNSNMLKCGKENIVPEYLEDGTYYVLIDSNDDSYVSNGGKSAWRNKELKGYVKVVVENNFTDNKKETFSFAITDGIHGIKETESNNGIIKLNRKDILMDLKEPKNIELLHSINKTPFEPGTVTTCVVKGQGDGPIENNNNKLQIISLIKDPSNKGKNKFEIGDKLNLEEETFLVFKETNYDNSDGEYVTIIASSNLTLDENPHQDPKTKDTIEFSTKPYWKFNDGNPYIYKENNEFSMIDDYLKKYKNSLEAAGITFPEKDYLGLPPVRLITYEEYYSLGPGHKVLNSSKDWWTGSVPWSQTVWCVFDEAQLQVYTYNTKKSVRPVLTIPKKYIKYL